MKKNRKAEDWLTDDEFRPGKAGMHPDEEGEQEDDPQKEVRLAAKVLAFFKSIRIQALPGSEKDALRRRIELSLSAGREKHFKTGKAGSGFQGSAFRLRSVGGRTRFIYRLSAAVLLVSLLAGSAWFLLSRKDMEMMSYVKKLDIPQTEDNTLLILGNQKEIPVALENAKINYQPGGKGILINNEKIENTEDTRRSDFHTVIVPYGRRLNIVLSDGTVVWLNSGSKLVYPASFSPGKREVFLVGEAIFDVAKRTNDRFIVNTDDLIVKVTGTVFNVAAYPDDDFSSAVLAEGKIELSSRGKLFSGSAMPVSPGTMVVFEPAGKTMTARQVNPDDYLSWREGFMVIRGEKLVDILKKLSRYYNKEMDLEDGSIAGETFSGRLDLKDSPREVLTVISRMVPLSVRETGDKISINRLK
jgi:hypothetical protein